MKDNCLEYRLHIFTFVKALQTNQNFTDFFDFEVYNLYNFLQIIHKAATI